MAGQHSKNGKFTTTEVLYSAITAMTIGIVFLLGSFFAKKTINEKLFHTISSAVGYQLQIGEYRQAQIFLEKSAKEFDLFIQLSLETANKTQHFGSEPTYLNFESELKSESSAANSPVLKFTYGIEKELIYATIVFAVAFGLVLLLMQKLLGERNRIQRLELHSARDAAIARTVQGLAHDVRKPLTMIEMVLDGAAGIENASDAKAYIQNAIPEIRQAKASVEGMLLDVMQIGTDSKPHCEETSVESILNACLNEVFRVYTTCNVELDYSLRHTKILNVDTIRIGRVCSNIVANAIQAMSMKGKIYFATSNVLVEEKEFIELRFKNTGSVIPAEHLAKLFGAFYTFSKKGGTGLGLAIAKKNVTDHGGTIRCESAVSTEHPEGFVEFIFTLPTSATIISASSTANSPELELPKHSQEIHAQLAALKQREPSLADASEAKAQEELVAKLNILKAQNVPFPRILITDDEAVYRNGFEALLRRGNELFQEIPFETANSSAAAYAKVEEFKPTIIIQDIDLGQISHNGIQIIKTLRAQKYSGKICVHSNRFLMGDQNEAISAGADVVLPKPMSRAHLLKFVSTAIGEVERRFEKQTDAETLRKQAWKEAHDAKAKELEEKLVKELAEQEAFEAQKAAGELPRIAFVDDSAVIRATWKMNLKNQCELEIFDSPRQFFEACEASQKENLSFLNSFQTIITDFHFEALDHRSGIEFAQELRVKGFNGKILLASNADFTKEQLGTAVNGTVSKVVKEVSKLF